MRRTLPKSKTLSDENPFSLSLGDLMAGLLLIFVLVLAFLMLNLREQEDRLLEIVKAYMKLREELYLDLKDEFEEDLEKWQAVLDRKKISVRFKEPTVLFKPGSCEVQPAFQKYSMSFFLAISEFYPGTNMSTISPKSGLKDTLQANGLRTSAKSKLIFSIWNYRSAEQDEFFNMCFRYPKLPERKTG